MPDMLVKLYDLPKTQIFEKICNANIIIRAAIAPEMKVVCQWIEDNFSKNWASEAMVAFSRQPTSIFIAIEGNKLLGFACYDATCRGFFGPTGVDQAVRGRGIGEALLFETLYAMRAQNYGYAIIGGAGPTEFYSRKVNATVIKHSETSIYQNMIK